MAINVIAIAAPRAKHVLAITDCCFFMKSDKCFKHISEYISTQRSKDVNSLSKCYEYLSNKK